MIDRRSHFYQFRSSYFLFFAFSITFNDHYNTFYRSRFFRSPRLFNIGNAFLDFSLALTSTFSFQQSVFFDSLRTFLTFFFLSKNQHTFTKIKKSQPPSKRSRRRHFTQNQSPNSLLPQPNPLPNSLTLYNKI